MQLLRSVLFTTVLFIGTLLYAVVVLSFGWLPSQRLYAIARSWGRLNMWLLAKLCKLTYTVEGKENIPPGAHVSMWKHSSAWETIAQAAVFPPQAWVLKRELMWIPLVGWAVKCLKPIAINRSAGAAAVTQVIDQGKQRLQEGLWILIFPEGTRVAVGESRKYGVSGSLLASKAGCKVIPVAHNAGYYWPRRGWVKKPGNIRVVIGPPIDAAGRDARELNEEVRAWIESTLTTLVPPTHAEAADRSAPATTS
ncbi:lysophospholipid acyltransferase family protein [Steroidobacter sp.]|uniref:lysophospholipid acyltransferase family protein n=1 Tax=Steroidobacter sp. TaxID=1978227 RepID=UPI001A4D732E|nr:lysophospholipid acyltransferase family protein [Steroidobacter sp.]MBL8265721.1 1-acyl-sn-glycerol-3-phosphate acyltransferase [Steroidobacter sp.]